MSDQFGFLAQHFGLKLSLIVLRSGAGYYIGTADQEGLYQESLMSILELVNRHNWFLIRALGRRN